MALTPAERQRRSRAHKAGDHSLCDPDNRDCHDVTPLVTTPQTSAAPSGDRFAAAGRRLWADIGGDKAEGGRRALAVEACRITDRLDKLDRLLKGDAEDWLDIVETRGNPDRQELVINAPLAEARQQATALKQILAELRQSAGNQSEQEVDIVDQLAARREARRANPAG